MRENIEDKFPYYFLLLYAVTYMANAVYNTFIPVYLNQLGFTKTITGILLALGPFVSIFSQYFWGITSDRARSKNNVLKVMVIGSAGIIILYPLSNNIIFLFAVITIFTFFQSSVNPLSDAMTLEYIESRRWKFGPIRLAGTFGFATMSVLAGYVINKNTKNMFILYFIVTLFVLFTAFRLPVIKGHQALGAKMQVWELFKNKHLMIFIAFNFVIQGSLGYYYSFFPIYFRQLGGSTGLLGFVMLISASSELPFLLNADRIINRIGIKMTLTFSALLMAVRWLLIYMITDSGAMLAINALHGVNFIVFSYCLATYINHNVPKELRASGQTVNALLCFGVARIIGSAFGGYLSDLTSIRQVFLYVSIADVASFVIFGVIFLLQKKSATSRIE